MRVETPEVKHVLEDYDFVFLTGMILPVTVNKDAGDTIQISDSVIAIHLVAVPSMNNPDVFLPERDITVFKTHLVSYERRTREVTDLAPEQQFEWARTFKELTKTVQ